MMSENKNETNEDVPASPEDQNGHEETLSMDDNDNVAASARPDATSGSLPRASAGHQNEHFDNSSNKDGRPTVEVSNKFFEHLSGSSEGIDLPGALKGRYSEDNFYRKILENPKHFKNFKVEKGEVPERW
ncbi:hypothetical protein AcW2_004040 [Taiwanofungus camphoratus]|nr:hypothetical protein AcW2_004040 [Antrodia cinnamomea]